MIPKEHEEDLVLILENILGTKILFCDTNKTQSERISSTIVSGMLDYFNRTRFFSNYIISEFFCTGAESVSNFLVQSAQKAEQFMNGNTPKIIEKINPSDRQRRVAPCVKNGIKIAKDVTSVTANVTGFVGELSKYHVDRYPIAS